jgi:hypothetical protein
MGQTQTAATGFLDVENRSNRYAVLREIAGIGVRKLLAALLFAGSCNSASAQLYAHPITNPDKPYQMDGYLITPPRGNGWFEMKRDRHYVYFGRRLSSPTHSFIAVALSAPVAGTFENVDAFREHVSRQLAETSGDQRNKIVLVNAETDPAAGPFCIRYQTKTEDRGVANARGRVLFAETFGVSCLHPVRKNIAIDVSYTERGLQTETGTLLRDEGEDFVRSLRFTPAR